MLETTLERNSLFRSEFSSQNTQRRDSEYQIALDLIQEELAIYELRIFSHTFHPEIGMYCVILEDVSSKNKNGLKKQYEGLGKSWLLAFNKSIDIYKTGVNSRHRSLSEIRAASRLR